MQWSISQAKRKEVLTHATTWMTLEDITVNEANWSQKDTGCTIPLAWVPRAGRSMQTEIRMMISRCWREGGNEKFVFNVCKISVGEDKKNSGDGWWCQLHKYWVGQKVPSVFCHMTALEALSCL